MQCLVKHSCVHEVIKPPTCEIVEGETREVIESCVADPETTTVVAEEVFWQWDGFRHWTSCSGNAFLGMHIEPWVLCVAEALNGETLCWGVSHAAGNDHTFSLGEHDSVDVVKVAA